MTTSVSPEVRARIERYLGRVEAHLEGVSGEEREEVLRDVESHVYDALARRAPEGATEAEAEAVLLEMDPPSSWGPAPRRAQPPMPTPPPPSARGGFPVVESILLGVAAVILFLCFLPVWGAGTAARVVPGYGMLAFTLLLAVAGAVAGARFAARTTGLDPRAQRESVSGASFVLLLISLGGVLVAVSAGAAMPSRGSYGSGFFTGVEARDLQLAESAARRFLISLSQIAITTSLLAVLLSWILGRIALTTAADGTTLTGWPRYRAAIAPALGSLAALVFLLSTPVMAYAGFHDLYRTGHRSWETESALYVTSPALAGLTAAALAAAILFGLAGALTRFAPSVPRFLFRPLADRLAPSQGKWFLIVSLVLALVFAGLLFTAIVHEVRIDSVR